jgi:hypothetical protein
LIHDLAARLAERPPAPRAAAERAAEAPTAVEPPSDAEETG